MRFRTRGALALSALFLAAWLTTGRGPRPPSGHPRARRFPSPPPPPPDPLDALPAPYEGWDAGPAPPTALDWRLVARLAYALAPPGEGPYLNPDIEWLAPFLDADRQVRTAVAVFVADPASADAARLLVARLLAGRTRVRRRDADVVAVLSTTTLPHDVLAKLESDLLRDAPSAEGALPADGSPPHAGPRLVVKRAAFDLGAVPERRRKPFVDRWRAAFFKLKAFDPATYADPELRAARERRGLPEHDHALGADASLFAAPDSDNPYALVLALDAATLLVNQPPDAALDRALAVLERRLVRCLAAFPLSPGASPRPFRACVARAYPFHAPRIRRWERTWNDSLSASRGQRRIFRGAAVVLSPSGHHFSGAVARAHSEWGRWKQLRMEHGVLNHYFAVHDRPGREEDYGPARAPPGDAHAGRWAVLHNSTCFFLNADTDRAPKDPACACLVHGRVWEGDNPWHGVYREAWKEAFGTPVPEPWVPPPEPGRGRGRGVRVGGMVKPQRVVLRVGEGEGRN